MGSTDSIQQIRKINDRLDPTDQKDNVGLRVVLIDIVRKRYKVCYINFHLNMSLSKINKSVVTV